MTWPATAPELLGVDVQHVPECLVLVAHNLLSRVQVAVPQDGPAHG